MARWWSIETGVIERIYDVSLGATMALIEQGFIASLIPHGESTMDPEELMTILTDHRESLQMVLDLVGGTRQFTTGWIKELHALFTRHQTTYRAMTPQGKWVDLTLEHGVYKLHPNSPTLGDGRVHEYCPPEHVASEMDRLVTLYHEFPNEFPEVRSAWLHHAFTQIHPFPDGNGRVARALASIDFIRVGLFPLLITRQDRDKYYLPALQTADQGELLPLVRFFTNRIEMIFTRAISESEDLISNIQSMDAVLAGAKNRVLAREQAATEERQSMARRLERFAILAEKDFQSSAKQVQEALPKLRCRASRSHPKEAHFFRAQMIDIAQRCGYWADQREPRQWARLRLSNGGETDIVLLLHFIGNPSPGACVAVIFLDHRDRKEEMGQNAPQLITEDYLLIVADEPEADQEKRFLRWLAESRIRALAQWARYL
jgi:Fic family protein